MVQIIFFIHSVKRNPQWLIMWCSASQYSYDITVGYSSTWHLVNTMLFFLFITGKGSNNIPKISVNFELNVFNNMHCDKYEKTSCCNHKSFNSQRFRRRLIFWLKTNGRFNYFIVDVNNRKFLLFSKEGYSGYLHS